MEQTPIQITPPDQYVIKDVKDVGDGVYQAYISYILLGEVREQKLYVPADAIEAMQTISGFLADAKAEAERVPTDTVLNLVGPEGML
jgi:hypothetical protein